MKFTKCKDIVCKRRYKKGTQRGVHRVPQSQSEIIFLTGVWEASMGRV
ncbi:MAG: hypothetical protein ACOX2O_08340 [Bdellovibrionota bacterium]